MEFKNSKTYAEAVTGNVSSSVSECWTHLQTQNENDALVLALKNSLQTQVG